MSAEQWKPLAVREAVSRSDTVRGVFEVSYRRLVGQLYGVCGDLTEAEEVVAEAFARAVQHQSTFTSLENPEAWLRTVAVNVSRTRYRRRHLPLRQVSEEVRHASLDDDRLALMAALRQLPLAQREAIALHYLADLPIHEVAEAIGVPVGTVKARLSRAGLRSPSCSPIRTTPPRRRAHD